MYIFTLLVIYSHVPILKSSALCDNCLVYSAALVSTNYLGSNNCSVDNNFHLLLNVLFPIALLFRKMSVWNIIQLRMSINTVNVIFTFAPIHKSCAMCDNCLVYSTSLVSNNYLDSNNCSVENNFHFTIQCLVSYCSSFGMLSVWNIIQLRMYIFTLLVIFSHVPILKSSALCDNCLVYSTSLVSSKYLGSIKYSVDNNLHLSRKCLVSNCSSV